MAYLGDFTKNDVVYHQWETTDPSGASVNPSTSGTVIVYKNSDQTQSEDDMTYTVGFDGFVGIHDLQVQTSGAFFTQEDDYTVLVSGMVVEGFTVNALLCRFSIENRYQPGSGAIRHIVDTSDTYTTVITVSGDLQRAESTLDTISGDMATSFSNMVLMSGNIVTLTETLTTVSGNLLTTYNDLVTASGDLLTTHNDIVTISGNLQRAEDTLIVVSGDIAALNDVSITEIVASGNIEGWNNDLDGVVVSGIMPEALSEIVASGNAEGWNNDLDGVVVSGIMPEALSELVASGNAEGWNDDIVTVSGIAPEALTEIVTSGNAASWNSTADVTTLTATLNTVSGDLWSSIIMSSGILGAVAGNKWVNAAGTQVKVYDASGALLTTLDRTGATDMTWTATWNQ